MGNFKLGDWQYYIVFKTLQVKGRSGNDTEDVLSYHPKKHRIMSIGIGGYPRNTCVIKVYLLAIDAW